MRVGIDGTSWANPRGYGRYTRNLTKALLAANSPHTFALVLDNHTAENPTLPANIEKIIIQTGNPMGEILNKDGHRSPTDIWAMTNGLRAQNFDAFFFPTLHTYYPLLNKTKKLVTIHDVMAEKYPDLIMSDTNDSRFWKFKSWLARRQADYIITVSDYSKKQIAAQFKIASDKIKVVPQAISPQFNPAPYAPALTQTLHRFGLDSTSRYLAYFGGLAPHKNLETLLEVFKSLANQVAFQNLDLVLIGPSETDTITPDGPTLRQIITDHKLDNATTITGYLPDQEVVHLLTAATVMVLPSIEEGFGPGAVEAAACGTAVIATKNSPLPDLLGTAGTFIDTTKTADLRFALTDLLTNDQKRQQMAQTAREKASQLTWTNSAESLLNLLNSLER